MIRKNKDGKKRMAMTLAMALFLSLLCQPGACVWKSRGCGG